MKQVVIDFDAATHPVGIMEAFMKMALLKEGKSNVAFNWNCLFLGRKNAVKLCFKKIFEGCDVFTYLHYCKQFCSERLPQLVKPSVEKEIVQAIRNETPVFVKFNGIGEVIAPYLQSFGKIDIQCTYRADIKRTNILTGKWVSSGCSIS